MSVLVDTSVWIGFLRSGDDQLQKLLLDGEVLTHELVIGELRVGNISKRETFLSWIENLPRVAECSHQEVAHMIEQQRLHGKGIGYADAQILASAKLYGVALWTHDKRLRKRTVDLGCAAD